MSEKDKNGIAELAKSGFPYLVTVFLGFSGYVGAGVVTDLKDLKSSHEKLTNRVTSVEAKAFTIGDSQKMEAQLSEIKQAVARIEERLKRP